MLIAIFGESCTGKTTLADRIRATAGAKVYSGKDYLRFAVPMRKKSARRFFDFQEAAQTERPPAILKQ